MAKIYYAIFMTAKGSKDLLKVVESADYANYCSATYHMENPKINYKVYKSNPNGFFLPWEKPIIINGQYNKKGAH